MKRVIYLSFVFIAVFASCNKEEDGLSKESVHFTNTITAYIDNSSTKTLYGSETNFQWLNGDVIGLQVAGIGANAGKYDKWTATSSSAGSSATFTHSDMGDWETSTWAFYPKDQNGNINCDFSKEETPKVTLSYSITPSGHKHAEATSMSCIPLIGKNQGDNKFNSQPQRAF